MSEAMNWLKAKAPGFRDLDDDEQKAIIDFSLLWGLFESRVLNSEGSAAKICHVVEGWNQNEMMDVHLFDEEIRYFQTRYYQNNDVTHHFDGLHLRDNDRKPMLRGVLDGSDNDPCRRLSAALIIVYRYRNNLFHGLKWQDKLADQLNNFNAANAILMKTLNRHGGI